MFLFDIMFTSQKERNPEKDLWRNSWGSNQSFVGKDDFWLALQSNYNYIMDTNLIDSCREARGELERNYSTETSHTDQKKVNSVCHFGIFNLTSNGLKKTKNARNVFVRMFKWCVVNCR